MITQKVGITITFKITCNNNQQALVLFNDPKKACINEIHEIDVVKNFETLPGLEIGDEEFYQAVYDLSIDYVCSHQLLAPVLLGLEWDTEILEVESGEIH